MMSHIFFDTFFTSFISLSTKAFVLASIRGIASSIKFDTIVRCSRAVREVSVWTDIEGEMKRGWKYR